MVLAPVPNGSVAHPSATVAEMERIAAEQTQLDAERAEQHFTGYARDLVTGDFAVYVGGQIVAWSKDVPNARERLSEMAGSRESASLRDEIPCSVELKMSAKGERYWDVKVYFAPGSHLAAIEQLRETDERMRSLYGVPTVA